MKFRSALIPFVLFPLFTSAQKMETLRFPVQGEYTPIESKSATIQGGMPDGWHEDSSWADVAVTYKDQTLNPHEGNRSLRIEVERVTTGRVQWKLAGIPVSQERVYRISVPIRSEENRQVTLTLRKQAPPHTSYWSQTLQARPEWGIQTMLASVKHEDPDAGLYFSLEGPGSLEVGEVTLEPLSIAEALADRNFEGNLLRSSSFPLGITAPWAVGANGSREQHAGADPDTIGPSGGPALRLETLNYGGRPMMQLTSPFYGKPGHKHTFSFWAKSEKPGMEMHLRLGPPSENIWVAPWQKTVNLTTEWTRYSVTVDLPAVPEFLYLARITSHDTGRFWIDQAMVEVGDKATAFKRSGPVELHARAGRFLGLSLEQEDMPVRFAVDGEIPEGSELKLSLLDLYEQETDLKSISLKSEPSVFEHLIPVPEGFGSHLLTAQVVNRDGEPVGKAAEVLLHRVRQPRHLDRFAPDSPFGTHFPSTPELLGTQKRLGFNWNRPHYRNTWNEYQQDDGSWNFASFDKQMKLHEEAKLLHLINLGGVERKYSVINEGFDTGKHWYRVTASPHPDHMDKWEDYCRRVFEHAGNRLAAVELWNEPFLPGFFVGRVEDGRPIRQEPEVMAEMMKRAKRAATATNFPGLLVWNTGPHYGDSELGFTQGVIAGGGAEQVDLISFHRYVNSTQGFPGDRFDLDLAILQREFAGKSSSARIWNSEGGHGNSYLFNLYREVPPANHREKALTQAIYAVRYYLSNFAAGAEKVFLYTMYPMDGWKPNYGYMNVDGQLSSVAPALSNLAWHLEDLSYQESLALTDDLHLQKYSGEERTVWVILPQNGKAPDLSWLPKEVSLVDVYGNPADRRNPGGVGLWYVVHPDLPDVAEKAGLKLKPLPLIGASLVNKETP